MKLTNYLFNFYVFLSLRVLPTWIYLLAVWGSSYFWCDFPPVQLSDIVQIERELRAPFTTTARSQQLQNHRSKWWCPCRRPSATGCVAWWRAKILFKCQASMLLKIVKAKNARERSHHSLQEQETESAETIRGWSQSRRPSGTRCGAWWRARIFSSRKEKNSTNR